MKLSLIPFALSAPFAASQCIKDNLQTLTDQGVFTPFKVTNECNYDRVVNKIGSIKKKGLNQNLLVKSDCSNKHGELALLLGLNEDDTDAAENIINGICENALLNVESDTDYAVNFEDIPLLENETNPETIRRFLSEFYDGGTFYNEQTQQSNAKPNFSLGQATKGINKFYVGPAKKNLVKWPSAEIDTLANCDINAAMCCWVQDRQAGDDNGNCNKPYPNANPNAANVWTPDDCIDKDPADNTDICYVDLSRSTSSNHVQEGAVIFSDHGQGNDEGSAHCHGFAWPDDKNDPTYQYRANNLFYVSMYDHLRQRGYVRAVPGAPMCGCLDKMPTVTRADCTEIEITNRHFSFEYDTNKQTFMAKITFARVQFNACEGVNDNNNDLLAHYQQLVEDGSINTEEQGCIDEFLVGEGTTCRPAVEAVLRDYGIVKK